MKNEEEADQPLKLFALKFTEPNNGLCIGGAIVEASGLFGAMELGRNIRPRPCVARPHEVEDAILRKVPEELRNRALSKGDLDKWLPAPPLVCRIPTEFITGAAGTGKSHLCRERQRDNPKAVALTATSAIAAVNMGDGARTINSLLGYYNLAALEREFVRRNLHRRIQDLAKDGVTEVVIDEISMLHSQALDLLFQAFSDVGAIKLTLTGDFCQLAPIPERDPNTRRPLPVKYAFEADCWPHFAKATNRLTKIWRQENLGFLDALNALRRGDGAEAVEHLQALGVEYRPRFDQNFPGTTLIPENRWVEDYNMRRLRQLATARDNRLITAPSTRWSLESPPTEWDKIPEEFTFRIGAYVMILANGAQYVNGDTGHVVDVEDRCIHVQMERTGDVVKIGKIVRTDTRRELPKYAQVGSAIHVQNRQSFESVLPRNPVYVEHEDHWIVAWIHYYPLRLAYATTVHKSQGLTIPRLQIDLNSSFIGAPAMMYVALSRCRTPGGLVLVGSPEQVVAKTKIDPRVVEWL